MSADEKHDCYEGVYFNHFQFYLQKSASTQPFSSLSKTFCPLNFKELERVKSSLDVLGVGSGGGEVDAQMLSLLQSAFPSVPITADIVEGSSKLTDNFKALVAKTPNLEKIQFSWHIMSSEEYEKEVKAKGNLKKFDFIHMIQMIHYVKSLAESIKFHHSLLKNTGSLLIVVEAANSGWDILWKTYKKELCVEKCHEFRSSGEVIAAIKDLGLKFEDHAVPNSFDITECFDQSSVAGESLLSFMTGKDHFYESFTPEVRAGMLELLKSKCSTEKDGRVFFNSNLRCIVVHA